MSDSAVGVMARARLPGVGPVLVLLAFAGLTVSAKPANQRSLPKSCEQQAKNQPLAHMLACRLLAATKDEQVMPAVAAVAGELAQKVGQEDWLTLLTQAAGGAQGLEQEAVQLWQNLLAQHSQQEKKAGTKSAAKAVLTPELLSHVGQWATRMAMGLIESGVSEQVLETWIEHILGLKSPTENLSPVLDAAKKQPRK